MRRSSGQVVTAAGGAAPLIAAESPDPVALSVRAAVPEVVMEPATRRRIRGPASKRWLACDFKVVVRRRSPGKRRYRAIPRRTAAESGR